MTWQEIQSKFENVKQDGWDEYQLIATCPAHDDRKPSLSIKLADDKVLIYCQAGCETKDVLAVAGLTMADLNLTSSVQEVYDYQDETGRTVQRRLRFIPKDFRWQHIEIDFNTREEVWRNGKGSYPELAYHMPDIIKAVEDNKLVIITEGEKDADNLLRFYEDCQTTTLGAAVTGPNDARLDALYPLEDYDNIVIIPDNDKSGLESARLIANWLINRGSKVKIVQIDGVKDISDWIKTGKYTSFDLEELIDRAKYAQFSGDPMAYLRKTYALLNVGGSPVALNLKAFSKGQIVTSSYDNFMHGDGGRTTTIKKKIKDKIVEIVTKVGPTWWEQELNSGMRTPVFKPGQKEVKADEFNFWNGWGVEPSEEGSCELFKDHLLNVVCSGNQDWYKFLWDWFCDMFQNPQEHNGVILAIQGNEGSGKSFIGEQVISRLLGDGGYHLLGDDKPLESQFTEFLANTLLLQLDESFFSGSHAVKNFLKHISVSKKLEINKKFLSGFTVDNYLHILVTSNADWFVPPGYLDRRYFVLKTTDAHLRDFPYFKAIMDQLEAGGFQRLLWELLTTKITSDWSKIPMTDVKQEQIEYGEPIKLWWKDCVLHHPLIDTTDETIEELEKLVLDSPMFPYEGQELTPTEFYQMFRCWYDATKQRGEFPRSVDAFGKKVRALVGLKSEEPKWITRDEKPTKSRVYVIRY